MLASYLPVLILMIMAFGFAATLMILPAVLGPKVETAEKMLPYESGMDPECTPKIRFNLQFYRIALLFLVFDIEAAFFYPWAVLFRDLSCTTPLVDGVCTGRTTATGLVVMIVFLVILLLGLVYVWRKRALEWE